MLPRRTFALLHILLTLPVLTPTIVLSQVSDNPKPDALKNKTQIDSLQEALENLKNKVDSLAQSQERKNSGTASFSNVLIEVLDDQQKMLFFTLFLLLSIAALYACISGIVGKIGLTPDQLLLPSDQSTGILVHLRKRKKDQYTILIHPRGWQPKSISVRRGDRVTISASGEITICIQEIIQSNAERYRYENKYLAQKLILDDDEMRKEVVQHFLNTDLLPNDVIKYLKEKGIDAEKIENAKKTFLPEKEFADEVEKKRKSPKMVREKEPKDGPDALRPWVGPNGFDKPDEKGTYLDHVYPMRTASKISTEHPYGALLMSIKKSGDPNDRPRVRETNIDISPGEKQKEDEEEIKYIGRYANIDIEKGGVLWFAVNDTIDLYEYRDNEFNEKNNKLLVDNMGYFLAHITVDRGFLSKTFDRVVHSVDSLIPRRR